MKEKILAIFVLVGFLMVFGGVGGMETDVVGLFEGTIISLIGFSFIAVAIFIANRENKVDF